MRPRQVVLLVGAAVLCAIVIVTGLAFTLANARPAAALAAFPLDAQALSRRADELLTPSGGKVDPSALRSAAGFARAALARDPTEVGAWRTLALASADTDERHAGELLRTAEALSRRDLPTELALIQEQVGRGDVRGALAHYDVALRVAPQSGDLLLPILVKASAQPPVRLPLARLLQRSPDWRRRFFDTMAGTSPSPRAYADLFAAMRRYGPLPEADIVRTIVGQIAEQGGAEDAWRIAGLLGRPPSWFGPVRNGSFADANAMPPLDWAVSDAGAVEASPNGAAGPGRLTVTSANGDVGRAAYQLLRLTPDRRYTLSAQSGPVDGSPALPLLLTLHCGAVAGPQPFATLPLVTKQPSTSRLSLLVPKDCASAWLEIDAGLSRSDTAAAAWVSGIRIEPDASHRAAAVG